MRYPLGPATTKLILVSIAISMVMLLAPLALSGQTFAAKPGVGDPECVPTKQDDCKDPQPANPSGPAAADPNGQGASGSDPGSTGAACDGLDQLGGVSCDDPDAGETAIGNLAERIVSIISYIAGVIAVIMILVSGVKYVTSAGDSSKVGSAKTTLVYALIGIAVAALAQVLVHFVLGQTAKA